MFKLRLSSVLTAIALVGLLGAWPLPRASADFTLDIYGGTYTGNASQTGNASNLLNSTSTSSGGEIAIGSSPSSPNTSFVSGLSLILDATSNAPGSAAGGYIDNLSVQANKTGTIGGSNNYSAITFVLSDSFSNPAPSPTELANLLSSLLNNSKTTATLEFKSEVYEGGSLVASTDITGVSPGSSGTVNDNFLHTNSTYELRNIVTISFSDSNTAARFDANGQVVAPEPSTIALLLSGIPALGLAGWIRRKRALAMQLA